MTVESMSLHAFCHAKLRKLLTGKVSRDKKDAKHTNVGYGNVCVIADCLIFKGADIHMHYCKKTNFVISS